PSAPVVRANDRRGRLAIICEPCWHDKANQRLGRYTETDSRFREAALRFEEAAALRAGAYREWFTRDIVTTPCTGCGRPVIRAEGQPAVCSKRCAQPAPAPPPALRQCESCHAAFTPTRSDARFCSSRCRVR